MSDDPRITNKKILWNGVWEYEWLMNKIGMILVRKCTHLIAFLPQNTKKNVSKYYYSGIAIEYI